MTKNIELTKTAAAKSMSNKTKQKQNNAPFKKVVHCQKDSYNSPVVFRRIRSKWNEVSDKFATSVELANYTAVTCLTICDISPQVLWPFQHFASTLVAKFMYQRVSWQIILTLRLTISGEISRIGEHRLPPPSPLLWFLHLFWCCGTCDLSRCPLVIIFSIVVMPQSWTSH